MNRISLAVASLLAGFQAAGLVQNGSQAQALTPEQAKVLSAMHLVHLDDGRGGRIPTIRIEGVNVQIVNGKGNTYETNGAGNLIVGYQELVGPADRTGSHNVIIGLANDYSSHSGLCSGYYNQLLGPGSTILSGNRTVARGELNAMLGGTDNEVEGYGSIAVGGSGNAVTVDASSQDNAILGGQGSRITGFSNHNVIVGGAFNSIEEGDHNVVVAGQDTSLLSSYATGVLASHRGRIFGVEVGAMLGGRDNEMGLGGLDYNVTMVGGQGNRILDTDHATVVGGQGNSASGRWSTLTGGLQRSVTGAHDWAAGELFQDD